MAGQAERGLCVTEGAAQPDLAKYVPDRWDPML